MWPLSGSGKCVLAVGAETSVAGARMTFPPPERKYLWGDHVALKGSKCTRKKKQYEVNAMIVMSKSVKNS